MKWLVVPFLALALSACAKSGDAPVAAKVEAPAIDAHAEIDKLVQPCLNKYWLAADQQIGPDHVTLYSVSKGDYALKFVRYNTPFIIVMRNADGFSLRWSTNLEDYN